MKTAKPDWYKYWSLHIKNQSWVEDTEHQVDFIIRTLGLTGKERILDLACGFGRHALSVARRGFPVVGVDITKDFIEDAIKTARSSALEAEFIHADIRDIRYENEFDVVLNLADGAIGYLENDEENLKIFDGIAKALKPGGKHFMDICNAEYAERFFPKRHWEIGSKTISLPEFDWDAAARRMLFAEWEIPLGQVVQRPSELVATSARLYTRAELEDILGQRNMNIIKTFSNYDGKEETHKELQLMVYSQKSV
jgi:2-polyprenyl-3-methyl-5-hydroxy-6-metoxy-1,4-benzoquinol methylase